MQTQYNEQKYFTCEVICLESMTEVTSEDLAGVYKDLAETVGVENAYKIYSHF